MLQCPQCTKPLRQFTRQCPSCQADLNLLVDYVSHLQGGIERAEHLTRAGELGQAFWAYLEVLEVDPDNPSARRQIGQVVTAVRQFDRVVPGRRWADGLPGGEPKSLDWRHWAIVGAAAILIGIAFAVGIVVGRMPVEPDPPPNDQPKPPPTIKRDDELMRRP